MKATTLASNGRVTIAKEVRQRLGIRNGTRLECKIVSDHVETRSLSQPAAPPRSGFGTLKSRQPPVPADFDPATLRGGESADA
jgi:AbrB family looped-hinge helix DNA binding protein